MSKVFISYRRDDSAYASGPIYKSLVKRFGNGNVFLDVTDHSIPPGLDFRQSLRMAVEQCDIMVVLIGRDWLNAKDEQGNRRLDNPNDFVRLEIEAALNRNIPTIPILLHGSAMPKEQELPASLGSLAFRQKVDIRFEPYFDEDVERLIENIERLINRLIEPIPSNTFSKAPQPPPHAVLPIASVTPDHFPERFASLGFIHHHSPQINGKPEYIEPSHCEIPAGPFLMGSGKTIILPTYQMARYPVTVAEYACFVGAGKPESQEPSDWQRQLKKLDHPVVGITWKNANDYAGWLVDCTGQSWRLPTEAEWEKAARGSGGCIYPWGDEFNKTRCNTLESGINTTTPVDSYPNGASPYKVFDMAGNVAEWTSNSYKEGGLEKARICGGSWNNNASVARISNLFLNRTDHLGYGLSIGFRLVLTSN